MDDGSCLALADDAPLLLFAPEAEDLFEAVAEAECVPLFETPLVDWLCMPLDVEEDDDFDLPFDEASKLAEAVAAAAAAAAVLNLDSDTNFYLFTNQIIRYQYFCSVANLVDFRCCSVVAAVLDDSVVVAAAVLLVVGALAAAEAAAALSAAAFFSAASLSSMSLSI